VGLDPYDCEEKLRKMYAGTYSKEGSRTFKGRGVHMARLRQFDETRERAILQDFAAIKEILTRYDIPMKLDQVFWRTAGKN
jgi:hypothetical protein